MGCRLLAAALATFLCACGAPGAPAVICEMCRAGSRCVLPAESAAGSKRNRPAPYNRRVSAVQGYDEASVTLAADRRPAESERYPGFSATRLPGWHHSPQCC